MKLLGYVLPIILLSACASTSGVIPMGSDTYMISRTKKGFETGSKVKADAIKEANEFCSSKGKVIEIVKSTDKDMVPFRTDAQAEIEFKCVPDK
ncbi:hypothetical protein [Sulfurirhabdus autotrophica]|uniref:Lipoprotein n=1 Tax=Sulfurirhabdus autotrophica TaxID=1706046 RepID=A0A4R3Y389_9PROT|nr:hypothetical protein [Sulfurirhabdus autotrophica]TCV86655.1 hypothetical protein EDC63_10616 [Sulfurirhabdus autotrophica]